jgi:K+-transporting ATPase KdpF subunit
VPVDLVPRRGTRMSAADVFGLVVSVLVIAYLFYALIRGENL